MTFDLSIARRDVIKAAGAGLATGLLTGATAQAQAGMVRPQQALVAKLYRLEAEVWVKEAEAASTPPGRDPRVTDGPPRQ